MDRSNTHEGDSKNQVPAGSPERTSQQGDDLRNPLTGETRRSEEQIDKDLNDLDSGGGFSQGGGQPFTG